MCGPLTSTVESINHTEHIPGEFFTLSNNFSDAPMVCKYSCKGVAYSRYPLYVRGGGRRLTHSHTNLTMITSEARIPNLSVLATPHRHATCAQFTFLLYVGEQLCTTYLQEKCKRWISGANVRCGESGEVWCCCGCDIPGMWNGQVKEKETATATWLDVFLHDETAIVCNARLSSSMLKTFRSLFEYGADVHSSEIPYILT
jgi:hypothetical protein